MEEKDFNELVAKIEKKTGETISEQVKSALKDIDVEKLNGLLEKELASKEDVDGIVAEALKETKKLAEEAMEKARIAAENQSASNGSYMEKAAHEIKENFSAIKNIANRSSKDEIQIKALTLRSSVAGEPYGMVIPGIDDLQRKARTFYDFLSKQVIPIGENHSGVIRYTDWNEATTVKAAAAVAEGAAFPESTAVFARLSVNVEKVGDTLPVTEEFFEDEALAAGELNLFLQSNVLDKVSADVINGDGSAPNIHSIDSRANVYTPVASGITDANIFDLCTKVKEDIETNGKFRVDFVLMNVSDYNKLVLKKDANNNYVFDMTFINSLPYQILVDNNVAPNTMYAGDSRFVTLYEVPGVSLSQGFVGTQFTEDEMTLKARKRLAFLIKNMNQRGFRKVSSVSAALTTLAT